MVLDFGMVPVEDLFHEVDSDETHELSLQDGLRVVRDTGVLHHV
jgi:hypothetical protein